MPDLSGKPFGDWRDDKNILDAETLKYSDDVWHFLQLESGLYAVYNHERKLMACVEFSVMEELYAHRLPVVRAPRIPASALLDTLTVDDLDLD